MWQLGKVSLPPYRLLLHHLLVRLNRECTTMSLWKSLRDAWCRLQGKGNFQASGACKQETEQNFGLYRNHCPQVTYEEDPNETHHVHSSHAIVCLDARLSLKTQGLHPSSP